MSKPEDIPQDVWNNADGVWTDLAGIHRSRDGETEIIARAIIAAKAEERTDIAEMAEEFGMVAGEHALVTFAGILRQRGEP